MKCVHEDCLVLRVDDRFEEPDPNQEPCAEPDDDAIDDHAEWIVAESPGRDVRQTECEQDLKEQEEHFGECLLGDLIVEA